MPLNSATLDRTFYLDIAIREALSWFLVASLYPFMNPQAAWPLPFSPLPGESADTGKNVGRRLSIAEELNDEMAFTYDLVGYRTCLCVALLRLVGWPIINGPCETPGKTRWSGQMGWVTKDNQTSSTRNLRLSRAAQSSSTAILCLYAPARSFRVVP